MSLLGDVLAVMDTFSDLPGVHRNKKGDDSLEELNSSQFTGKSDEGQNNQEVLNLEVIGVQNLKY